MFYSNNLKTGFSPCPNDTFIFDAIINRRIKTEGLTFTPFIADVERLNRLAFSKELPVTKLSYFAYSFLTEDYVALNSGSALGKGCGPILVSRKETVNRPVSSLKIGIPGKYTTANLLLTLAFTEARDKHEMLFSRIESAILSKEIDAGLIIHENRFTYQQKGLVKIVDLGNWWEERYDLPIPLGGIFIRRDTSPKLRRSVDRLVRASTKYAINHPADSRHFVKEFASELNDKVIDQHIDLYVNRFSVDLGEEGRNAVTALVSRAAEKKIIPPPHPELFVK